MTSHVEPAEPPTAPQPAANAAGMPRSGIRVVMDLAWAHPGTLRLEVGEPSFPTPPHIVEAAARAARDGWTHYVPNAGIPALREALADKLRSHNGIAAEGDQVVVTNGGVQALYLAMTAVADAGDEVLLPDPGWPNFESMAHLLHLRVRRYRLRPENDFLPDPAEIEALCGDRTRAVLVNSPSNPLGTIVPANVLAAIAAVADRRNLWVISDECYDAIAFEPGFASLAAVGDPGRTITCCSFSKTHAMTGWRVGYAHAPPHAAAVLTKLQEPTIACVNAPAQHAALAALTGPQDHVRTMVATYRHRRDALLAHLHACGLTCHPPAGAFYAWVPAPDTGLDGLDLAVRLVREEAVAVAPGSVFGPSGDGWVRLSLAAEESDLIEGATRLAHFLHRHRAG